MKKMMIVLPLAASSASYRLRGNGDQKQGASAAQVTGAGSTFVYPVLSAWAADYKAQGGSDINYQSIGLGRRGSRRSRPARSTSAPATSRLRRTSWRPAASPSSRS